MVEDQVATFTLIQGSGPVYVSGTHQTETNMIGEDDMDDLGDEEGEDEEEEDDIEDSPVSFRLSYIPSLSVVHRFGVPFKKLNLMCQQI